MGCSNSSSAGGCKDTGKDMSDSTSQDDKHRDYGGVYVGHPPDASTSYRDSKGEAPSKPTALNATPESPIPENVC